MMLNTTTDHYCLILLAHVCSELQFPLVRLSLLFLFSPAGDQIALIVLPCEQTPKQIALKRQTEIHQTAGLPHSQEVG